MDPEEEEKAEEEEPLEKEMMNKSLDVDGEDKEEGVSNPSKDDTYADMLDYGVWLPCMDCLFDMCIIYINLPSYRKCNSAGVIRKYELRMNKKYLTDCHVQQRYFTLCIFLCEVMMGGEAEWFLKHISIKLVTKWHWP